LLDGNILFYEKVNRDKKEKKHSSADVFDDSSDEIAVLPADWLTGEEYFSSSDSEIDIYLSSDDEAQYNDEEEFNYMPIKPSDKAAFRRTIQFTERAPLTLPSTPKIEESPEKNGQNGDNSLNLALDKAFLADYQGKHLSPALDRPKLARLRSIFTEEMQDDDRFINFSYQKYLELTQQQLNFSGSGLELVYNHLLAEYRQNRLDSVSFSRENNPATDDSGAPGAAAAHWRPIELEEDLSVRRRFFPLDHSEYASEDVGLKLRSSLWDSAEISAEDLEHSIVCHMEQQRLKIESAVLDLESQRRVYLSGLDFTAWRSVQMALEKLEIHSENSFLFQDVDPQIPAEYEKEAADYLNNANNTGNSSATTGFQSPRLNSTIIKEFAATPHSLLRRQSTAGAANLIPAIEKPKVSQELLWCAGCDGHIPYFHYENHLMECATQAPEADQRNWILDIYNHITTQWNVGKPQATFFKQERIAPTPAVNSSLTTVQSLLPLPPLLTVPIIAKDQLTTEHKLRVALERQQEEAKSHVYSSPGKVSGARVASSSATNKEKQEKAKQHYYHEHHSLALTSVSGRFGLKYEYLHLVCGYPVKLSADSYYHCPQLKKNCFTHLLWEEIIRAQITRQYLTLTRRLEQFRGDLESTHQRLHARNLKSQAIFEELMQIHTATQSQMEAVRKQQEEFEKQSKLNQQQQLQPGGEINGLLPGPQHLQADYAQHVLAPHLAPSYAISLPAIHAPILHQQTSHINIPMPPSLSPSAAFSMNNNNPITNIHVTGPHHTEDEELAIIHSNNNNLINPAHPYATAAPAVATPLTVTSSSPVLLKTPVKAQFIAPADRITTASTASPVAATAIPATIAAATPLHKLVAPGSMANAPVSAIPVVRAISPGIPVNIKSASPSSGGSVQITQASVAEPVQATQAAATATASNNLQNTIAPVFGNYPAPPAPHFHLQNANNPFPASYK
jgi:hypothetical protein